MKIPHYYSPTIPYDGCRTCGLGPGALVHNAYYVREWVDELERFEIFLARTL